MIANYHTHTYRCGHAVGSEEDYINMALNRRMKILGFSDHTPQIYPNGFQSHIRMLPEQLAGYCKNLTKLQQQYAGEIEIHIGLEAEYYPKLWKDLLGLLSDQSVEYLILGQHWAENEMEEPYIGRPTEDESLLQRYCDRVLDALQTGCFSYIAHPDVIHFVGDDAVYKSHIRRLCQGAKSCDIPLEINFGGLRANAHYPNRLFWEIAAEENCRAVFGIDAHAPEQILDIQAQRIASAMAEELGLRVDPYVELRPIHP